jgi:hypothetical protein
MTNDTLKQMFEMKDSARHLVLDDLCGCCLPKLLREAWGRAWDAREVCDNNGPAHQRGECEHCDEWHWLMSVYDDLSNQLGMRVASGQMVAHEAHDEESEQPMKTRDVAAVFGFNNTTTKHRGH